MKKPKHQLEFGRVRLIEATADHPAGVILPLRCPCGWTDETRASTELLAEVQAIRIFSGHEAPVIDRTLRGLGL